MRFFYFLKKSFVFGALVILFFAISFVSTLFVPNVIERRKFLAVLAHRFSKIIVHQFGIDVAVRSSYPDLTSIRGIAPLVIANHISYLDVLVLLSIQPGVFVTSREIRDTPGLGWFVRAANCIFVDRINKTKIYEEVCEISNSLRANIPVFLFPEAGSSDGQTVRPFKRAMLHSAAHATNKICPIVLRYEAIDGVAVNDQNRSSIAFFGEMKFLPHFLNFLWIRNTQVSVCTLTEVFPLPLFDSKEVAKSLQQRIQLALQQYA